MMRDWRSLPPPLTKLAYHHIQTPAWWAAAARMCAPSVVDRSAVERRGLADQTDVAAARPNKPIILTCGGGGFMMHAQELNTIRRNNLPVLICMLNEGAYGAEIHKLRADKLDNSGLMFSRRPLASIAKGFGLQGATITRLDQIVGLPEEFKASKEPTLWDFHVSDQVASPMMRRGVIRPK